MSPAERIGKEALELIDHLAETYGDDFKIGAVAIVVDVVTPDGSNPITYSCSDPRRWVQLALLSEAVEVAEEQNAARVDFESEQEND